MNWDINEIGTFTLNSGTMRISDPCYNKTVWCSGTIPNCVIGEWQAGVAYYNDGMWGRRVALLVAKVANSSVGFDLANDIYALTPPLRLGSTLGRLGCTMMSPMAWTVQLRISLSPTKSSETSLDVSGTASAVP